MRGWWKRERAIIIPPFRVGGLGRVWIRLEVGRWKMSTCFGVNFVGLGKISEGIDAYCFRGHDVGDRYEQLF